MHIKQIMNTTLMGLFLGYPQCCIKYFALRLVDERIQLSDAADFTFNGTGFIPCPKCNSTKGPIELHTEIASNRKVSTAFPESPMHELDEAVRITEDNADVALVLVQHIQQSIEALNQ